jgi:pSer/pThr/pTyr-binding forkhead associated (FHA) protein
MSELAVTLLRLGYLLLLWVFVLSAIGVLRRDLYGTRILNRRQRRAERRAAEPPAATPAPGPVVARRTNEPTRLVVTEGGLRGTTLPLGASPILIGRAPSCTLVLDDDYSSSRHARIYPDAGQWFVEDLGSTNGTFLDGSKVEGSMPIPLGAPVRIGQSVIELQR